MVLLDDRKTWAVSQIRGRIFKYEASNPFFRPMKETYVVYRHLLGVKSSEEDPAAKP